MKRIIVIVLLVVLSFTTSLAQENRVLKRGQSAVNVYYGVNLLTGIYRNSLTSRAIGISYKQVGPLGLVYEYLVTDEIGIGAELGYTGYTINFIEPNTNPITGLLQNYNWQYKWTTIRAMFRANFHFAKSEKFDAYGLISAGLRQSRFSYTTNDPSGSNFNRNFTFIPVGIKPGIGFRYFFVDNVGVNMEIALGTPIMCGGLSFKF